MMYICPKINARAAHTDPYPDCYVTRVAFALRCTVCITIECDCLLVLIRAPSILIAIAIIHVPRLHPDLCLTHDVRPIDVLVILVKQRRRVPTETLM